MDDGEYELVEVTDFGQAEPRYVRGRKLPCRHTDRVDVVTLDWRPDDPASELVAQLCTDCDAQLPAGFIGVPPPPSAADLNMGTVARWARGGVVPPDILPLPTRPDPGEPDYNGILSRRWWRR